MSAEKKYTEREMVFAKRDAFVQGNRFQATPNAIGEARRRYPFPKVERPRVRGDGYSDFEWRVVDGKLQWRRAGSGWNTHNTSFEVTTERAAIWNDLFTNPTEWVDDEGSGS